MVETSKSPPGAFAAAIKRADTRTRAQQAMQGGTQPAKIEHGHEAGDNPPIPRPANSVLEQLKLGRPRNADGSPRED